VARPKGASRPVELVTFEDMTKLLAACASEKPGRQGEAETARNQAILWLALESGLRRFELAALKLSDVARVAHHPEVAHAPAALGGLASWRADARHPAHSLRHAWRYRVTEWAPLRPMFEQKYGHVNDHAQLGASQSCERAA
jgi:integrase